MGKVGSSTVLQSLHELSLDMYIYHVHTLTYEWIKKLDNVYKIASKAQGRAVIGGHLVASIYLFKRLDKKMKHKRIKIVTLVRDPVAHNISEFFQGFDKYFPDIDRQRKEKPKDIGNDVNSLIEIFLEEWEHFLPLVWFDVQMKPVFKIDVFSEEFPKSQGYSILKRNGIDLLVIKSECLNACAGDAFREFQGVDNFSLVNTNIGAQKHYAHIYKEFLEKIILPDSYLDRMYTSKLVQHFYSDEEIAGFKGKWSKNKCP
jgi:hypothetical protein